MGGRTTKVGLFGLAVLALLLPACQPSPEAVADGDDPLAALAAPAQSARYDGAFWTREAHRNSRLWRAAKDFCSSRREVPNCHPVELVRRWEGPLRQRAPAALPVLPPLAPPPPRPPAMHPGEPGYIGADVAALKAWEAQLLARRRDATGGRR